MTPLLRFYLLVLAAPAVALTAALLGLQAPAAGPGDPILMVVLIVLAAIATNFPVMVSPRYQADAAPAVYLAAVLLFAPAGAVAVIGASGLLGEGALCLRYNPATGHRRRAPIDLVFNTSQLMLAGGLAVLVYRASGATLPGAVLAGGAMYATTTALVAIAAGLHNQRNPIEIWAEVAAAEFKQTAALYVAGYLLAVLSIQRPWLAIAMMVPVAAIQIALTRTVQLREQTISAVESMADVVDRRDPYTGQHSQSVADHSVRIARALRLPESEIELIRLAARVHDLGKIAVPDEVLHKHGRLTESEFELMKKHPETGVEILAKFPEYRRGRELVLAHHERIDGLGYPRRLTGKEIPLGARIIAVADSWDAMTSDRPYRKALAAEVALAELLRGRGTQWEPAVVDAFAGTLPGAVAVPSRHGLSDLRPLLRSLGAAVGVV
ncbi:MAG TPA: HD-GYP domain-containing protein [Candidatus Dormibacteraeota bacterium]|nr:HD-GYP domain-containing protein [Candidatus Dormibacteraeota bacterium]